MDARLSRDERRAVAERIFAALCAHYPDHYIALFERPQLGTNSPEPALTTSDAVSASLGADDSTTGEADISSAGSL
jgi:hypothetical protein